LRLPSEAISVIVADDGASAFFDNNASRFLDQDTVALAHLPAGAAHVIEPARIILCRRRHEGALRLRRRGPRRRYRWLQRGWGNGGLSKWLLWRNRTRWLPGETPGAALTLLLRARRRLRNSKGLSALYGRLDLLLYRRWLHLTLLWRRWWRLDLLLRLSGRRWLHLTLLWRRWWRLDLLLRL
jgi:hypothetical protein